MPKPTSSKAAEQRVRDAPLASQLLAIKSVTLETCVPRRLEKPRASSGAISVTPLPPTDRLRVHERLKFASAARSSHAQTGAHQLRERRARQELRSLSQPSSPSRISAAVA